MLFVDRVPNFTGCGSSGTRSIERIDPSLSTRRLFAIYLEVVLLRGRRDIRVFGRVINKKEKKPKGKGKRNIKHRSGSEVNVLATYLWYCDPRSVDKVTG